MIGTRWTGRVTSGIRSERRAVCMPAPWGLMGRLRVTGKGKKAGERILVELLQIPPQLVQQITVRPRLDRKTHRRQRRRQLRFEQKQSAAPPKTNQTRAQRTTLLLQPAPNPSARLS